MCGREVCVCGRGRYTCRVWGRVMPLHLVTQVGQEIIVRNLVSHAHVWEGGVRVWEGGVRVWAGGVPV